MNEINDAELGRSNKNTTPRDHLQHLLNIGWNPQSPLIQKYVKEHGLRQVLDTLLQQEKT
ncbi:MAG: hypothetical protein HY711_05240 [Candidatus Melainabacteria bacterium]|nr:hypothetical protein [Candidatus Melainabacteria bacterium]